MFQLSQHPRIRAARVRRAALRALQSPGHNGQYVATSVTLLDKYRAQVKPSIGRKSLTARVVEVLTSGKAARKAIEEARKAFHTRLDSMPDVRPLTEWVKCSGCDRIVKRDPRTLADLALHRVPSSTRLLGGAHDGPPVTRTPRTSITPCPVREVQMLALLAEGPIPFAEPVTGIAAALQSAPVSQAWVDRLVRDYSLNHRDKTPRTYKPRLVRESVPQSVSASNEAIHALQQLKRADHLRQMTANASAMADK